MYQDDEIVGYRLQRQHPVTGQITEHIRCVLHWDESIWGAVVHTYQGLRSAPDLSHGGISSLVGVLTKL